LARLVGVDLTDIFDVTSDSHLTTFAEVAFLVKAHESVVVGEVVYQVCTIIGSSADNGYRQKLTAVTLSNNFGVEDTSSDNKSVELSVASLIVGQSETLIKNMKKESRC
jgi:hypothetical protein